MTQFYAQLTNGSRVFGESVEEVKREAGTQPISQIFQYAKGRWDLYQKTEIKAKETFKEPEVSPSLPSGKAKVEEEYYKVLNPGGYYDVYEKESGRKLTEKDFRLIGLNIDWIEKRSAPKADVTEPAPPADITQPVPDTAAFKDTDAYKALSDEEREIVDLLFNVISIGGEEEAKRFADAIQQSIAVAEPWAKAQAAMALAEFAGAVDETIFGFAAKTEAIQRARDILAEDVSMQKEFLSLEQQAEVARQVSQYDQDLLSIADQAAEKGLTFATGARSRQLAETRRTEQFQDVIQSSRRKTNFQIKELELKAARGDVDAQKELETLAGKQGFALRKIGRSAEEVLGSERARALGVAGFEPVGGVAGTLKEEKEKRIISDVGGIVGLTDLLTT